MIYPEENEETTTPAPTSGEGEESVPDKEASGKENIEEPRGDGGLE